MRCARGANDAGFQNFCQPILNASIHPVDLVQHQRAAVAMLQHAGLAFKGAGKGALLMPEQQRFQ